MRRMCWMLSLLGSVWAAAAQPDALDLDDLVRSAQQWAQDNLSDDALRLLQSVDEQKVRQFFAELQKELQGDYVVDLAPLRDAARAVLPVLEQTEQTAPYALWLKSRLDYLEVAEQLRLIIPPPKLVPGKAKPRAPNPAPEMAREIWIKKLAQRPWPKAARPYVSRLKPVFAEQKVPAELVWVAEVESGFDPRARSPAGAAGLFQLMPATAQRYGLRTWPLDQRLKPEASARAAAQCLRALHQHFRDWRLALAAYNAGQGTVDKLLARRKAKTFDAIAPFLPAETQLYVPKVEAVVLRREGIKLSKLKAPRS